MRMGERGFLFWSNQKLSFLMLWNLESEKKIAEIANTVMHFFQRWKLNFIL